MPEGPLKKCLEFVKDMFWNDKKLAGPEAAEKSTE